MNYNFRFTRYSYILFILFLSSCNFEFPEFPENEFVDIDHLEVGNPSNATTNLINLENYLIVKPEYTLSYNSETSTPNWVSWHLSNIWIGQAERQDDFRADADIPSEWYRVTGSSYRSSGFDRGHICPSADRTFSTLHNSSTFVMSNIVPQSPDSNRGPWADLESYCRNLVFSLNQELYIIAGVYGKGGTGSNGRRQSIDSRRITVPKSLWKVIVVLDKGENDLFRINSNTRVIAVDIPNRQGILSDDWFEYKTTVDDIEEKTGFDLLSNLPSGLQEILESQIDEE